MAILKLVDIKLDGGTQFRESINQDKVKEYKELMLDDVVFKPIDVVYDGEHYYLVDGFHRYFAIKAMSLKSIEVKVTEGTLQDAIRMARRANNAHGMPRSIETKRRVVISAINDPENEGVSAREIARECVVSHPFVLNIMKELQGGNVTTKPPKETKPSGNVTTPVEPKPPLTQDFAPSEEELEANQLAIEADIAAMNKLLDSDDALATAHEEIKRLNLAYANLESRFNALMREKDKAVELLQKTQRELDKIKKAKK
jgi:hypothetical protein